MKLKLTLTKSEIIEKFANELNVDPSKFELDIVEDEPIAEAKEPEPEIEKPDASEPIVRFLDAYLDESGISSEEAAQLTEVHATTIRRARRGFSINSTTFGKIVSGLGLKEDQIRQFKKSLTRHQPKSRYVKKAN